MPGHKDARGYVDARLERRVRGPQDLDELQAWRAKWSDAGDPWAPPVTMTDEDCDAAPEGAVVRDPREHAVVVWRRGRERWMQCIAFGSPLGAPGARLLPTGIVSPRLSGVRPVAHLVGADRWDPESRREMHADACELLCRLHDYPVPNTGADIVRLVEAFEERRAP